MSPRGKTHEAPTGFHRRAPQRSSSRRNAGSAYFRPYLRLSPPTPMRARPRSSTVPGSGTLEVPNETFDAENVKAVQADVGFADAHCPENVKVPAVSAKPAWWKTPCPLMPSDGTLSMVTWSMLLRSNVKPPTVWNPGRGALG